MVILRDAGTSMNHPYNVLEEAVLKGFRQRVDLSPEVMTYGRYVRDTVIQQCEALSGDDGFPVLLAGQTFTAGSFGRRTQAQPLTDIDLYLVMNAGGLTMWDFGAQRRLILVGQTPGPLTYDPTLSYSGWLSADLVAQRIADRLADLPLVEQWRAKTGLNDKRKSSFIRLPDGLNVDVTPVLWATGFTYGIDRFFMPQGRESLWWTPTNPKEDQRRLSAQNRQQDDLLLPVIRMLKWWNDNRNGGRLKGILLETLVENGLRYSRLDGLAQALHMAFCHIQIGLDAPPCLDPTGLGPPLDVNLSLVDRTLSVFAANSAHVYAVQAADAFRVGNVTEGIQAWASVFPGLNDRPSV